MFIKENERIYMKNEDGKLVAEITFPETAPGVYTINHTFVDDSLRGQGVAGKLVELAVATLREKGFKVEATCSYALKWLEKEKENI